eukprot:760906-Hanusia_phi.AAC.5
MNELRSRPVGSSHFGENFNEFRDALNATVDMLCRAIQQQSVQIKELRSRVDELEKKETRNAGARQQEWQSFQWLFDTVSSDDEDTDNGLKVKLSLRPRHEVSASGVTGEEEKAQEWRERSIPKRRRRGTAPISSAPASLRRQDDGAEGEDTDEADDGTPQSAGKVKKFKKDSAVFLMSSNMSN